MCVDFDFPSAPTVTKDMMLLQVLVMVSSVLLSATGQNENGTINQQQQKRVDRPTGREKEVQTPDEMEAAKNARYFFSSDVEDESRDFNQHRDELRDGLKVKGSYSYNDGFFKRKVVYEADENGYRVISDEIVPLAGPKKNVSNGIASIRTNSDGTEANYTLTQLPVEKIVN